MRNHRLRFFFTVFSILISSLCASQEPGTASGGRILLGRLSTQANVSFIRTSPGQWGIEIAGGGAPRLWQSSPAQIEVFYKQGEEVRQFAGGYTSVERTTAGITARAEIHHSPGVSFRVEDHWSLNGAALQLHRRVSAMGNAPGGFYSAIRLSTAPDLTWPDADYFAPGLLYGDPSHDGDRSPGSALNYQSRRFTIREDLLAAPLFGISFRNGASVAVLDSAPRGDTTREETRADAGNVLIDERYQFGALGAQQSADGGIEFGFWLPGTTYDFAGSREDAPVRAWRRRYHPIRQGFSHTYRVAFRFGEDESFRTMTRNAYRWAWQTLKPPITCTNIDLVRRTLIDHLASQVLTIDGRTGLPFYVHVETGKVADDPFDRNDPVKASMRAIMGFVGKNIEGADQLLREADRDPGPRGDRLRKLGLAIIDSFIRIVPMDRPVASGFNIQTGELSWNAIVRMEEWFLRGPVEDMRMLLEAYRRERRQGRDHPEWLRWARQLGDWVLSIQRVDGSFPRSFKGLTGEIVDTSGTTSYNPVPLLLRLTEETGDPKYKESALRAAEYVWANYGTRGLFVGGAIDNPNIVDKEAGMLSLEAFMMLYEATHDTKWLKRAQVAADYASTWIWIWNLPMPVDSSDAELHWKKGVPTVGLQGITAAAVGGVDYYLEWAVPAYAKLYKYTHDPYYLDVTRILLHNTHAMLALPGRTFDMLGPGWQQEHWGMGPGRLGRGIGWYRYWLPWVSTNQLYGITGLEEFDPALFNQLCAKPDARR